MFKKIFSVALAATMLVGTFAITANAAETDEVVAAEDSSAVGAEDSAVGADSSSDTAASDTVIYFDANSTNWLSSASAIRFYLYQMGEGGGEIIQWGSKKGNMKEVEGKSGVYSFDVSKVATLDINKNYGCIFYAVQGGSPGAQTCDVMINTPCYGHTAACTGNELENTVDSNKTSIEVTWDSGVDSSAYGVPLAITSTGKVIGSAIPKGQSKYSIFVDFLKNDGPQGLSNAIKFNEFKDDADAEQKTVDSVAAKFGIGKSDVKKAIAESGKTIKWDEAKSTLSEESSNGVKNPGAGGTSTNNNTNTNNSNSGSGSSSSSGSSSVSSGQESTLLFVLGGVMLASAGVIFLARKKREF